MTYKYNETLAEAYVQMVEEAKTPTYDSDLHKELVDHVKNIIGGGGRRSVYNDKLRGGGRSLNSGRSLTQAEQDHIGALGEYGVYVKTIKPNNQLGYDKPHNRVIVPVPTDHQVATWEEAGRPSLGRPITIASEDRPSQDRKITRDISSDLDSSDLSVRLAAIKQPMANGQHIEKALTDVSPEVRAAAAAHPNVTPAQNKRARSDADTSVVRAAKSVNSFGAFTTYHGGNYGIVPNSEAKYVVTSSHDADAVDGMLSRYQVSQKNATAVTAVRDGGKLRLHTGSVSLLHHPEHDINNGFAIAHDSIISRLVDSHDAKVLGK